MMTMPTGERRRPNGDGWALTTIVSMPDDGDEIVLGEGDALALLAGIPVYPLVAAGFDPGQPRDTEGRWRDGLDFDAPDVDVDLDARERRVKRVMSRSLSTHSTDVTHTGRRGTWTPERDAIHREIARDVYERQATTARSDRRALIAGGLGGSGKTTTVRNHAGIDTSEYVTVNPDDVKEELARRGLHPTVPGAEDLSPMEHAPLVHLESHRVSKLVMDMAIRDGKNVIWDVAMSNTGGVMRGVGKFRDAGYDVDAVFVDVPVETAVERSRLRYREGVQAWLRGEGLGGRYVPPDLIRAQGRGPGRRSVNRVVFDQLRDMFDSWRLYDNSGDAPRLRRSSDDTTAAAYRGGALGSRGPDTRSDGTGAASRGLAADTRGVPAPAGDVRAPGGLSSTDAYKFNPRQPRDSHGRWVDVPGIGGVRKVIGDLRGTDEFRRRLRKASSGRKALRSAKTSTELGRESEDIAAAFKFYVTPDHDTALANLRKRKGRLSHMDTIPQRMTTGLDAALERSELTSDVEVLRGVGDPRRVFGDAWDQNGDNTGLEWRDHAFVSTTTDRGIAELYATRKGVTPVVMRMFTPRGTRAVHVDDHGSGPDLKHLMLDRGLRYRIVNDDDPGRSPRRVDVEVIPDNDMDAITSATAVTAIAGSDHWKRQLRAPRGTPIGGQWVDEVNGFISWITRPSDKKIKPTGKIYKKGGGPDEEIVSVRSDGNAVMRRRGSKFVVQTRKSSTGSWTDGSPLIKKAAYDRLRGGQDNEDWREPDVKPLGENDDESAGLVESQQVSEAPPEAEAPEVDVPEAIPEIPEAPEIAQPEPGTLPTPTSRTSTKSWPFAYESEPDVQVDYGHLARMTDDEYDVDPDYRRESVPVRDLVPTQDPDQDDDGLGEQEGQVGGPFAVRSGDNTYLIDGHHRAQAAGPDGSIDTWVLNLDTPSDEPTKPNSTPVPEAMHGTKRITPTKAVYRAKITDGEIVAMNGAGGERVRWDQSRKKFVFESRSSVGEWSESTALNKKNTYNRLKNEEWYEPGTVSPETTTSVPESEDVASPETPESDVPQVPPSVETTSLPISDRASLAELAPDSVNAVRHYVGSDELGKTGLDHSAVNQALRFVDGDVGQLPSSMSGIYDDRKQIIDLVRGVDDAMAKSALPSDTIVYRGISDPELIWPEEWNDDGDNVGISWSDGSFISTTTDPAVARRFAEEGRGVIMRITAPAGTRGIGIEGVEKDGKIVKPESEILLERNLNFRIVRDYEENGVRTLDVEITDEPAAPAAPAVEDEPARLAPVEPPSHLGPSGLWDRLATANVGDVIATADLSRPEFGINDVRRAVAARDDSGAKVVRHEKSVDSGEWTHVKDYDSESALPQWHNWKPEPAATPTPEPEATPTPTPTPPDIPESSTDEQVTNALEKVLGDRTAAGESEYLPLADVRDALGDLSPTEVDDALRRLSRPGDDGERLIMLIPEADQKTLTQRDRDAAVIHGNQSKHQAVLDRDVLESRRSPDAEGDVTEDVEPTSGYEGPRFEMPELPISDAELDEFRTLTYQRLTKTEPFESENQSSYDMRMRWHDLEKRMLQAGVPPAALSRIEREAMIQDSFAHFREVGEIPASMTDDELRDEMARRTREAFADKKIAVRVTPGIVEKIVDDGRVKSQFESGTSKGLKNLEKRAFVEQQMFGIPYSEPKSSWDSFDYGDVTTRPIYGYVALDGVRPVGVGTGDAFGISTDALSQYGQVQVVLKDDVRRRTTAMFGDSLNNSIGGLPAPVDDPSWQSFTPQTSGMVSQNLRTLDRDVNSQEFRANQYAEAQIHGGVTLDDVEEVVFPNTPPKALREKLDERGVPWRVLNLKTAVSAPPDDRSAALRIAEQDLAWLDKEIERFEAKQADYVARGDSYTGDLFDKDLKKLRSERKKIADALPALRESVAATEVAEPATPPTPERASTPAPESTVPSPARSTFDAIMAQADEYELLDDPPANFARVPVIVRFPETPQEGKQALPQSSMTQVTADALSDYMLSPVVSRLLRKGIVDADTEDPKYRAQVDAIDAGFANPESHLTNGGMVTYRGVRDARAIFGDAWPGGGDATGLTWQDLGYTSTSTDRSVANYFAFPDNPEPVAMHIALPDGTPVLGLMTGEHEVLLPRGTRFEVVRDHGQVNDRRLLDVVATPPETEDVASPETPEPDTAPAAPTAEIGIETPPPSAPAWTDVDDAALRMLNDGMSDLITDARALVERRDGLTGPGGNYAEYLKVREQVDMMLTGLREMAQEKIDLLARKNGEPWGSIDTDADQWSGLPQGVSISSATDTAAIQKIRDMYVVNDDNTIANNASLRSGDPTPAAKSWRGRVRKLVNSGKMMNDAVVYRGAALPPETIMTLQPGAVITDPGIMSVDVRPDGNADFYASERLRHNPGTLKVMFDIRVPKDTPAADVSYGEFVFKDHTSLRIVSTQRDDDGTVRVIAEMQSGSQASQAAPTVGKPTAPTAPEVTEAAPARDFDTRVGDAVTDKDALDQTPMSSYTDLPDKIGKIAATDIYEALNEYMSYGYSGINGALRIGKGKPVGAAGSSVSADVKKRIRAIDALMKDSPLQSDIVVHRGMRVPQVVFGDDIWFADGDMTGVEWVDHGFTSTSANLGVAERFTYERGSALMRVLVPKGHKAVMLSHDEYEILLKRGTRFRVARDNGVVNGVRQLDVEVIG